LAVALSLGLGACGSKKDKPATQVAAKVNSGEISVHQINFVLQQQRGLRPEQVEQASRVVLERLIDQEIAVQKAEEAKLDRDPRVVQALEAAKRDVLARAWLERMAEGVAKPGADEVEKYFKDKPALFANRRVYTLQEINIAAPREALPTLESTLKAAKGADAFTGALKAANMQHTTAVASRAAESLPLELLDRLAALNPGQGVLVPQPNGARVFMVLGSQAAPVTLDQARPAIEAFLLNQARRQRVSAEVKAMRGAAKVEYMGKFAEGAPPAGAALPSEAAASEAPALPALAPAGDTAAPAAAPAPAVAPATPVDADAVTKGLKLK